MTEYWVSNAKHWCKFCKTWVQGDKASVRHHEQGARHKQAVEEYVRNKRKRKDEQKGAARDLANPGRRVAALLDGAHRKPPARRRLYDRRCLTRRAVEARARQRPHRLR